MPEHSTARQRAEYQLDTIPADRNVSIPLRDLLFTYNVLREFVDYFHSRTFYPSVSSIESFLFSPACAAYPVLKEAVERLNSLAPPDIQDALCDGDFDNPVSPHYYYNDQDA